MGKSATKIDIGPSIRDWQTAQSLALNIGVSANYIYGRADTGNACNGYLVVSREPVASDNVHAATQRVYRVGYEEELVIKADNATGDELTRAYHEMGERGASPDESLVDYIRRVSAEPASVKVHKKMISAQDVEAKKLRAQIKTLENAAEAEDFLSGSAIPLAAHRLALEEKDRAIQQLRDLKPSDEAKRLKAELEKTIEALKLSKKSTFNAYLAGKREALEFHSIRGRVRRAAQRAGHAFLRGIS